MLDVNLNFKPTIKVVGLEQTPVVVIDDFCLNIQEIQHHASQAEFSQDNNSYYPGIRSQLPNQYIVDTLKAIYQGLYKTYGIPRTYKLQPQLAYYSLITQQPETLSFLQRFPHFDTPRKGYFAVLHYINENPHGGTGFFRHKASKFERITDDCVDEYMRKCNEEIDFLGGPQAKYHTGDSDMYELYDTIDYKPNRLVIYPGNLLHSTLVNNQTDIDNNPCSGRLTANMFVEFVN